MARRRSGRDVVRVRAASSGKALLRTGNSVDLLVGHRVRALRLQHRFSQQALGAAIGASVEEIRQFEAGLKRIGAARLLAIAKVFDTEVGVLFGSSGTQAVNPMGGRAPPNTSRLLH